MTYFMHGSSCFGCCLKPKPTTALDVPSKGSEIHDHKLKKPSKSEDFWSSSTFDMDNSAAQSQGSISSISTSNPTIDPQAGNPGTPSEFVNHGLILWNQNRQCWRSNKRSENQTQQVQPKLNWSATYDNLLGSDKPFPHPIPLSEMVDFLVDTWEQEGLYD
ncbi:hypothetical protein ACJRO7_005853 [Eucalyptus globulus]|uniref:Gag1-like clamp domain-containing protein n=1 Tax=Eucalyptus globulus TaxID=34317 RepID=A0ABD3J898_EUCGL